MESEPIQPETPLSIEEAAELVDQLPVIRLKDAFNIPGLWSMSRLPLGIGTAVAIHNHQYEVAAGFIGMAGVSDNIDGKSARKRGLVSGMGMIEDPFFDRVFEILTIGSLTAEHLINQPLGAGIIASEAAAMVGAGIILKKTGDARNVMPTKVGKVGAAVTFMGGGLIAASASASESMNGQMNEAGIGLIAAGFGLGILGRLKVLVRNKRVSN